MMAKVRAADRGWFYGMALGEVHKVYVANIQDSKECSLYGLYLAKCKRKSGLEFSAGVGSRLFDMVGFSVKVVRGCVEEAYHGLLRGPEHQWRRVDD